MSVTFTRRTILSFAALTAVASASPRADAALDAALSDARLPAAKTVKLFGSRIRYVELGTPGAKPTLVLVHGLGSSAAGDWGQVMRELAKTHHVIAPDQLGFGQSDKPFITYGIQTWVDFLGEFLRETLVKRGVTDFALMGESLGGWIAVQYTLQALRGEAAGPSFVLPKPSRLVLCDAAGFGPAAPDPARSAAQQAEDAKLLGGPSLAGEKVLLGRIFHAPSFSSDDAVRRGLAWSLAKGDSYTIASFFSNRATAAETIDGRLGGITIPTLVIWGAHDQLVPIANGERYVREIAGARWVVIPDAGHAPMIETPQAFLAALGGFLKP